MSSPDQLVTANSIWMTRYPEVDCTVSDKLPARLKVLARKISTLLHLRFCHFDQSSLGSPARQHGAQLCTPMAHANRPGIQGNAQLSRTDARAEINVSKGYKIISSLEVGLAGKTPKRAAPGVVSKRRLPTVTGEPPEKASARSTCTGHSRVTGYTRGEIGSRLEINPSDLGEAYFFFSIRITRRFVSACVTVIGPSTPSQDLVTTLLATLLTTCRKVFTR